MNKYRKLIEKYNNRRPLINIILDGYGIGKQDYTDGIYLSDKPLLKDLFKQNPSCQLLTHGPWVGLPGKTDMGGSEVGHFTIGAGIIVKQGARLIKDMIDDKSFFNQPVMEKIYKKSQTGALHLIGLLSDGNIHSHLDHFIAVIKQAAMIGVKRCYLHALLDGRDTKIQSALEYTEKIEQLFFEIMKQNKGYDYRIVSGGGREIITMDRAKEWSKVELGWKTHVLGASGNNFNSVNDAINHFRKKQPDLVDQDLPPFNITDKKGKSIKINDNDVVFFINFRGDRAIEFSRAFCEKDFKEFPITNRPNVYYAGMMKYDEDTNIPKNVVLAGASVENPFGKRILELGLTQFRLAETQKFPHVTFFFNGGYRLPLDKKKEDYILIKSDKLKSFAQKPKMKALEIANEAIKLLDSGKYDYGLINFANPDMVGHTGDIEAVKIAINTVDKALSIILKKIKQIGGLAIITADHGNADEMIIYNKATKKDEPSTKHSLNPVPLAIYDPAMKKDDIVLKPFNGKKLTLAMIAATNFILLGKKIPSDLETSLFDI